MESDSEEEMKNIKQVSTKIENISKKEGLREGISAGRDSHFQESFDKGYEEGFKNGFLLGKFQGCLIASSKQTSTEEKMHQILDDVSKGSCEICKNNELTHDEDDIDKLIEIQNNSYENNLQTLQSSFKEEELLLKIE